MRLIGISRCDGDQRTPKYFDATLGYNNGAASLPTRIVVVVLTRVESWSLSVVVVTFTMSLSKKRKFSDILIELTDLINDVFLLTLACMCVKDSLK